LTHVADLPSPGDLVRKLKDTTPPPLPAATPAPTAAPNGPTARGPRPTITASGAATAPAAAPTPGLERYARFKDVVELIRTQRDVKLLVEVEGGVRLISYAPGRITFAPTEKAPANLAQRLGERLQAWTGNRWAIAVEAEGGAATITELRDAELDRLKEEARAHPMVQAVFDAFPGAKILEIRTPEAIAAEAEGDALQEVEDEWDPFDES
ncbi:MAG: DNA polymerase III subunit gamma/tau, partial [Pseudomonadota bacterium]